MPCRASLLIILAALAGPGTATRAAAPPAREVVLVDTDIGDAFDDALALALVLSSPRLEVGGVTTVHGDAFTRALLVCRLLHAIGRDDVPVAAARPALSRPDFQGQMQYGLRPCFRKRPVKESAVEFLYRQLKARPGQVTLLALGPLTNVAELFRRHPECRPWVRRVVLMGGSLRVDYDGKPRPTAEYNIKEDVRAAQAVFASGVTLVVVPLDVTYDLALAPAELRRVLGHGSPLTDQLAALFSLWAQEGKPLLFDALAALFCHDPGNCTLEPMHLSVGDDGITRAGKGKPDARVVTKVDRAAVLRQSALLLTPGAASKPVLLKPPNLTRPIERGAFPARVHVFEDYETDIERRWWLAGRLVPGRACQGVLTDDFDDRMGDPRGLYTGVIFNPVPGPPMGKNTRLAFRCRLDGSDLLRVQIYSLSKGYHRHLSLTGLAQGRWLELTVDMTRARRPDGSGGPLAEGERIDDIQFYTQRRAELLIDDVVLYDAASAGEKRTFPKRLLFTGWFDTGRQGVEWPGSFDIVADRPPLMGKAARSVLDPDSKRPWVRLDLRGPRPIRGKVEVRFRYLLTGGNVLKLEASDGKRTTPAVRVEVTTGKWVEKQVPLDVGAMRELRELRFRVGAGATLEVDDVLIFEP